MCRYHTSKLRTSLLQDDETILTSSCSEPASKPATFVALALECVGYSVVARNAAGANRRAGRSLSRCNGEPDLSITWMASDFALHSRSRLSVSSQAPSPHSRLPNCAEVGAHLWLDAGLERCHHGGNWRMGFRGIRQLFRWFRQLHGSAGVVWLLSIARRLCQ